MKYSELKDDELVDLDEAGFIDFDNMSSLDDEIPSDVLEILGYEISEAEKLRAEGKEFEKEAAEIRSNQEPIEDPKTDPKELAQDIMEKGLNNGMDYNQVLTKIAGFPKFSRSQLKQDPWYKQLAYYYGDIFSGPGRAIMSLSGEGEVLETMGKPSESTVESIVESPAGIAAALAGPVVAPIIAGLGTLKGGLALAGIGAAESVGDELYQNEDNDLVDLLVAGSIGAAAPSVGKGLLKLVKAKGIAIKNIAQLDKTLDDIKGMFIKKGVDPDFADEIIKIQGKKIASGELGGISYIPKLDVKQQAAKKVFDSNIDTFEKQLEEKAMDMLSDQPWNPKQAEYTVEQIYSDLFYPLKRKLQKEVGESGGSVLERVDNIDLAKKGRDIKKSVLAKIEKKAKEIMSAKEALNSQGVSLRNLAVRTPAKDMIRKGRERTSERTGQVGETSSEEYGGERVKLNSLTNLRQF